MGELRRQAADRAAFYRKIVEVVTRHGGGGVRCSLGWHSATCASPLRDFGVYFLTVVLGVAVFYAFNSMTAQQGVLAFSETQDRMFDLLGMVIGGVSAFVAFVLVFLVVYASRFLVRRRKREFGLYLTLGMRATQVARIVVLESLMVGVASLAVGLAAGFGLSQLLLYVTSALFEADVASAGGFAFVFSPDALVSTVCVFAAIFVLAACVNARSVASARLIASCMRKARGSGCACAACRCRSRCSWCRLPSSARRTGCFWKTGFWSPRPNSPAPPCSCAWGRCCSSILSRAFCCASCRWRARCTCGG